MAETLLSAGVALAVLAVGVQAGTRVSLSQLGEVAYAAAVTFRNPGGNLREFARCGSNAAEQGVSP